MIPIELSHNDVTTKSAELNMKMRSILVVWLADVTRALRYTFRTFHLCCEILDRFLALTTVRRRKLQCCGIVSLSIAAKMEEISTEEFDVYKYICDSIYTKSELLRQEKKILQTLAFDLQIRCTVSTEPYRAFLLVALYSNRNVQTLNGAEEPALSRLSINDELMRVRIWLTHQKIHSCDER